MSEVQIKQALTDLRRHVDQSLLEAGLRPGATATDDRVDYALEEIETLKLRLQQLEPAVNALLQEAEAAKAVKSAEVPGPRPEELSGTGAPVKTPEIPNAEVEE